MPDELDDTYNKPITDAFRRQLRGEDGLKANLFATLQEIQVDFIEAITQGQGYDDTEERLLNAGEEMEERSLQAIQQAQSRAQGNMEDAHSSGYEAAAAAASTGATVPNWTPSVGAGPFDKTPFDGSTSGFLRGAIEEEVSYFKQDLKYIRKYVDEDRYAKAVAQVLTRGDDEIVEAMARRGIDLNDLDPDALKGRAAQIFQNTKTMGSPDIRGLLKEIDPGDLAARGPQLWNRVKMNGTDNLSRVLDEAAKDLSVQSPAVEMVLWTLSTRHGGLESSPDECDALAGADAYGYGAGAYPPEKVPSHPHPNCECRVTAQTRPPEQWGQPTPDPPQDYQLSEDAIRQQLEATRARMGEVGRTVTDRHVERVREQVYDVLDEVNNNPRG
jgi:hypothetical protein